MSKYSRYTVGSVVKAKPGDDGAVRPDYVKLKTDSKSKEALIKALTSADESKGLILRLESKKQMLDGINTAEKAGKLSAENAVKARERAEKVPDFVRFELVLLADK